MQAPTNDQNNVPTNAAYVGPQNVQHATRDPTIIYDQS